MFVFVISVPVFAQETATPAPTEAPAAEPAVAAPVVPAVMGEKRELILKFIDTFGTKSAMEQNLNTMFDDMGSDDPQTQKFKDNVRVDEILEQLMPLYDKYFTEDELKAFIAFYSSPEGKKLLETIPVLMQESVDISAEYFEQKFPVAPEDTNKNATQ